MGRVAVILVCCCMLPRATTGEESNKQLANFQRDNLVAWCIVPFDAKHRSPAARAEMVKRLGLGRVAYDWRQEHVAEFEEEILQYQQHGIEYFAFWSWHDAIEPLIRKYMIRPQIWQTCPSPEGQTQETRVKMAAESLLPLVEKTQSLGLQLGLYNHGGWGGEPQNLIEVCQYLRTRHNAAHVGVVYNLHHGHGHITDFPSVLKRLKPYLLCLNLNGMRNAEEVERDAEANKIVPISAGRHESEMIGQIIDSKYNGPIGILGHRSDVDVEIALRLNLDGLQRILNARQK